MVTFPYNTTDFAFTLDNSEIEFSTNNNSYFTAEILIKYYDYYASTEKTITLNYKIPLFNGVAKWQPGPIIHRYISSFTENFTQGFQCKVSLVSFTIKEIEIGFNIESATYTLNNVKFIPGKKPLIKSGNFALLEFNTGLCKAMSSNKITTTFLIPPGNHTLNVLKNEAQESSSVINATSLDAVYTTQLDLSLSNYNPGDKISFEIDGTSIKKEYVIFPESNYYFDLYFVNQHKSISYLCLSGEYSFPDNYRQITHTYKDNLSEVVEVVDVLKDSFLKINSGWILKNQLPIIDQLFLSKKVFINNIEGLNLEMVPVSKKRVGEDSENFLYEYDLEFRINKISYA